MRRMRIDRSRLKTIVFTLRKLWLGVGALPA